jgi:hypothetical protein
MGDERLSMVEWCNPKGSTTIGDGGFSLPEGGTI